MGILKREQIEYSSDELMIIVDLATANTNVELMIEMRQKIRFDQQVIGFCKSINLDEKFFSEKHKIAVRDCLDKYSMN